MSALSKIFGSHSERELKRIYPIADKVESYKEAMGKLSDEELKDKTREFKKRLEDGATLDDILPEAFATVREAAKRVLGMEHYRVQIIGGIILHQGRIAEMRTGEGKTLVSTLPAYLNALEGKGVCIVTVNDLVYCLVTVDREVLIGCGTRACRNTVCLVIIGNLHLGISYGDFNLSGFRVTLIAVIEYQVILCNKGIA